MTLSIGPDGVTLNAGAAGKFTLPAPKLIVEGGNPRGEEGVMEVKDDNTLTVKFVKGDATITINPADISLTYTLIPQEGVKSLRVLLIIPITFAEGGKFSFGADPLKALPAAKGDQFLSQTRSMKFTLVNSSDAGFTLNTLELFQELTDARVFGMPRFVDAVFLKAGTNDNKWTLTFAPYAVPAPAGKN